jgi:hypothetical protein
MDLFDKLASEGPAWKPSTVQAATGDPWPLSVPWTMTGDPWPLCTVRTMGGDPWPISTAGVLQIHHATHYGLHCWTVRG